LAAKGKAIKQGKHKKKKRSTVGNFHVKTESYSARPSKRNTSSDTYLLGKKQQVSCRLHRRVIRLLGQLKEKYSDYAGRTIWRKKYFDYFVFKIVDCGLIRSGARRRTLAQTIGNARGLNINSPRSAEAHTQDL
jgi:hypothetical protein